MGKQRYRITYEMTKRRSFPRPSDIKTYTAQAELDFDNQYEMDQWKKGREFLHSGMFFFGVVETKEL